MLFVTGITGSLGVEVLRLLIKQPHTQGKFLIRAKDSKSLSERWSRLFYIASDGKAKPEDFPDLVPVSGDVTEADAGLTQGSLNEIYQHTDEILHIAATVDFDEPLDSCRLINVQGTQEVLNIALKCANLKKFGHISTLYIAGRRTGDILETELEHEAGFVTTGYEQSKYEAEILVKSYFDQLPICMYRMSLLMGCIRNGYVHDYGAIQRYLMYMYKGIAPCFPGYQDSPFDFLPHDYSAECLMNLFNDHFSAGETYQISAGNKAPTAKRWLDLTAEVYAKHSRSWANNAYNVPDLVEWSTYQLYKKTVFTIDNLELMKVIRILDSCAEELFCPKVFDRDKVNCALDVGNSSIPNYEDYYPIILDHCIKINWGLSSDYVKV